MVGTGLGGALGATVGGLVALGLVGLGVGTRKSSLSNGMPLVDSPESEFASQ